MNAHEVASQMIKNLNIALNAQIDFQCASVGITDRTELMNLKNHIWENYRLPPDYNALTIMLDIAD